MIVLYKLLVQTWLCEVWYMTFSYVWQITAVQQKQIMTLLILVCCCVCYRVLWQHLWAFDVGPFSSH